MSNRNLMTPPLLSLLTAHEAQGLLAEAVRRRRKALKLSREALARTSTVPASTIKRFETTANISLRQFLLLWQCVDTLDRMAALAEQTEATPRSIEDVLAGTAAGAVGGKRTAAGAVGGKRPAAGGGRKE